MFYLNYEIEKCITIEKNSNLIFSHLSDLNLFKEWSPWACLDDNTQLIISGNKGQKAHQLHWKSEITGEGLMAIDSIGPQNILFDLTFLKPFKSKSKVTFKIENNTVTWMMKSQLPFFLFFLKKMMQAYVGRDFERGLIRLKLLIENGKINCDLSDCNIENKNKMFVIGIKKDSQLKNLALDMQPLFEKIFSDVNQKLIDTPNGFITIYDKLDGITGDLVLTAGVFYYQKPTHFHNYQLIEIPEHQALGLTLKGPYLHLASAWAKLMAYARVKKIKENKHIPIYEIYLNSPQMVSPQDIMTEIRMPIK